MSSLSGTHDEPADLEAPPPGMSTPAAGAERALRPDVQMLRRAQEGDRAAYGQLVVLYQDRLYNAVLRLVGDRDEAAELTQETFTRGLMKLDTFRGDASPYTWLFRIAVNLAISQLRKVRRNRVFSLDRPNFAGRSGFGGSNGNGRAGGDDSQAASLLDRISRDGRAGADNVEQPPHRIERRERDQQVVAALGRLDAEYRAVLVMRDVEGFDYQQMADVLGLPLGTLKSRLFRARLALREELQAYLSDQREK